MASREVTIAARLQLESSNWNESLKKTMSDSEAVAHKAGENISKNLGDGANSHLPDFNPLIEHVKHQSEKVGEAFHEGIGDKLKEATSEIPLIGEAFTALSGPIGLAVGAAALFITTMFEAMKESEKWDQAVRGIDVTIGGTVNKTGLLKEALLGFAESMSGVWAIPKEEILKAEQTLSTFDGVSGTTFKNAIKAAADMSAVFGGDLSSNTEKVGTALQNLATGNVKGLEKGFKFLGIEVLNTIKTMDESGNTIGAQNLLLKSLQDRIDGGAAAKGAGLTGALFNLKETWVLAMENIGDSSFGKSALAFIVNITAKMREAFGLMKSGADTSGAGMEKTASSKLANDQKLLKGIDDGGSVTGYYNSGAGKTFISPDESRAALEVHRAELVKAVKDDYAAIAAAKKQGDEEQEVADKATENTKSQLAAANAQRAADAAAEQAKKDAAARLAAAKKAAEEAARVTANYDKTYASLTAENKEQDELTAGQKRQADITAEIAKITAENKGLDDARLQTLIAMGVEYINHKDDLAEQLEITKKLADAQKKASEEAVKAAEKLAADSAKAAKENLDSLANLFDDAMGGKNKSFWKSFEDIGKKTISRVLAQFVLGGKIDIGQALTDSGGGGLVSLLGLGANKTAQVVSGGSATISGSDAFSGLTGNFAAPGLVPFVNSSTNFNSGAVGAGGTQGFSLSGLTTGLKSALPALGLASGIQGLQSGGIGGALSGIAGIGGALGSALGTGGALAGTGIASALGGFGTALTAASPYLAVAAIAIPLLAGLFKGHDEAYQSVTSSGVGSLGGVKNDSSGQASKDAGTLANAAYTNLQSFATSLGATLKSGVQLGALGGYDGKFTYDSTPGSGHNRDVFASSDDAIKDFITHAISDGAVSGLSQTFKNLLTSGGDLTTQENKAITLKTALDAATAASDPLTASIKAINANFTSLKSILDEGGASAEEYSTIQSSYAKQISDATTQASATLKSFADSLKSGSNSPLSLRDQETASLAKISGFETDIGAGKAIDQSAFTAAAGDFLNIEKSLNGATDTFFSAFDRITTDTNNAIANVAAANTQPTIDLSPVNANTENTADNTADIADNTAAMLAGINTMNQLLQSNGLNGFANTLNTRATV